MYTALYRAYRPEIFDEILGQEHIVRILKNQIDTDSTSHAYLFCGTRGTGKTTTARILAKGLNCLSDTERPCGKCSACISIKEGTFLDVIEIDAASNNGVDNIRELRESVKYPPAAGRKKVYIIDEVHMLSTGAFNALLKTLEEPPEYVVFILATTEPQKLPATILSRCMRLDFKRVPENVLMEGMEEICRRRNIEVSSNALRIIAANADGSVRDGLSILDQCISGGDTVIEAKDVLEFLGASGEETFVELTDSVIKGRTSEALVLLAGALADGKDVRQFMRDWVNHYRNLLMTKFIKEPQDVINMSVENIERIRRQSEIVELVDINRGILEISRTLNEAKWSTQPRILLELAIVKLSSNRGAAQAAFQTADEPGALQTAARATNDAAGSMESLSDLKKNEPSPRTDNEGRAQDDTCVSKTGESRERGQAGIGAGGGCLNEESREEDSRMEKGGAETGKAASQENSRAPENSEALEYDYESIWKAVFEDGEAAKGSFYIIGSSARLVDIDENSFTVSIKSEHVKNHAERNRALLEELMEKHTGTRRVMKIVEEGVPRGGKEPGQKSGSIEDIAQEAGELLGIDVEIK